MKREEGENSDGAFLPDHNFLREINLMAHLIKTN
jgi:hypothetical protein